uniref:Uncharacterized protein n=1 Tax=Rangifer tarandus platyrhynchus TaxID=3082113 RepID=A0ACB0FA81_RANTA|nr:unnamed protein product [Rangifer tarandus platyrhynchus]
MGSSLSTVLKYVRQKLEKLKAEIWLPCALCGPTAIVPSLLVAIGYRGSAVTKETKAEALGCRLRLARVTPTSGGSRWVGWVRWRRAVATASQSA